MATGCTGELEASVILEYEERLVRRRREVRELQEQRDRLLATQRKLQQLHQSIADTVWPHYIHGCFLGIFLRGDESQK